MVENRTNPGNLFRHYLSLLRALQEILRKKKVADHEGDFDLSVQLRAQEANLRDEIDRLRGPQRRESALPLLVRKWPFTKSTPPFSVLSNRVKDLEARVATLERLVNANSTEA
jgi:hypothetical protein